jgi:hypothetical protein
LVDGSKPIISKSFNQMQRDLEAIRLYHCLRFQTTKLPQLCYQFIRYIMLYHSPNKTNNRQPNPLLDWQYVSPTKTANLKIEIAEHQTAGIKILTTLGDLTVGQSVLDIAENMV